MSLKLKLIGAVLIIAITSLACIGYGDFGSSRIIDTVNLVRHGTYPVLINSTQLRQLVRDSNNAILLAIDGDEFFEEDLKDAQLKFNKTVDDMLQSQEDKQLIDIRDRYNEYVESGLIEGRRMLKDTDTDPATIQEVSMKSLQITKDISLFTENKEKAFSRALDDIISFAKNFQKVFSGSGIALFITVFLLSVIIFIILKALKKLTRSASSLSSGDLDHEIIVDRNDELGLLQSSFEKMRVSLSDHIKNLDKKVEERTVALEAAKKNVQDILDAISQGIFTFNFDMKVNPEHSKQANLIFNRVSFENVTLADVLGLNEQQKLEFEKWLRIIQGMKKLRQFKRNAKLVPVEEYILESHGEERHIQLEFQPVIEDEKILSIMVLAKDVTEERKVEQALAEARLSQEASMNRVMSLINNEYQDIANFLTSIEGLVLRYQVDHEQKIGTNVHEYFREVHTAKGSSGTIGFERLEKILGDIEGLLDIVRQGGSLKLHSWNQKLNLLNDEIGEIERLKKTLFREGNKSLPVNAMLFNALIKDVNEGSLSQPKDILKKLREINTVRLEKFAMKYSRLLKDLSLKLNKTILPLKVEGDRMNRDVGKVLDDMIVHLIRNAVDHGIEENEVRKINEKSRAEVTLNYSCRKDVHVLVLSDNGQGIDVDKVWESAFNKGYCKLYKDDLSQLEKLNLIFLDDLSTREVATEISGRGVGMAAVKKAIEKLKGTIEVSTELGKGTSFVVTIPDSSFLEMKDE